MNNTSSFSEPDRNEYRLAPGCYIALEVWRNLCCKLS